MNSDKLLIIDKILCFTAGGIMEELPLTCATVYSMLNSSRHSVSIGTIKKLCDGLGITLGYFFSCPLFDELEQEIQ